jgi:UDP-N-acetylglucosamine/UDP-N-acetylgalactosamine diphosphorylase
VHIPKVIYSKLQEIKQTHLLSHWSELSLKEKENLSVKLSQIDFELYRRQKKNLKKTNSQKNYEPLQKYCLASDKQYQNSGKEFLSTGKVASLIVAGGQASRLRFNGPKGTFPISPIKKRSFFQIFSEKIVAATNYYNSSFPLGIMTSPLNHLEIITFFEKHNFFGLNKNDVLFFPQEMFPLLNHDGDLFLETPSQLAVAPNGNGAAFHVLKKTGGLDQWLQRGIEHVVFIQIDNPLVDPLNPELIGMHVINHNDLTSAAVLRTKEEQKLGVFTHKCHVVEYSELPPQRFLEKNKKGSLLFQCANISQFCFSLEWINSILSNSLPMHLAHKSVRFLSESGETLLSDQPNGYKFEYFIFDLFIWAKKMGVLAYPIEDLFSPLKNFSGNDSPKTVQKSLLIQYKKRYEELTNQEAPKIPFELPENYFYSESKSAEEVTLLY